jgi:tripartite-type tricarboxylate transporter receptor subunit TctC
MLRFVIALLFLTTPTLAAELKIVVPSASDGYAMNARVFGKYLSRYLAEKPTIVIQEVPGAFSLSAANYLYNVAPKDGTVIGTFYRNIPFLGALGGTNVNYDARKFTWIGSTADGRHDAYMLWSNKPGPIERYRTEELIIGSENITTANPAVLVRDITKIKVKEVTGYNNSAAARLAVDRNEVDAVIYGLIGIRSGKSEWIKPDSKVFPLIQFGNGRVRHKDYPTVPALEEYADNKTILSVYESQNILIRPFVAPPGISPARASELREAFNKAVTDPEFLEEATKVKIDVNPIDWKESESIVDATYKAPESALNYLRDMK